jgi:hypothetical protein
MLLMQPLGIGKPVHDCQPHGGLGLVRDGAMASMENFFNPGYRFIPIVIGSSPRGGSESSYYISTKGRLAGWRTSDRKMDHFPVDSTGPGGACGAGSDLAERIEGAVCGSNGSGPYATRQESQCGERSGEQITGLIHGKRKCRVQQSLKLGEESGKKMFAGHGSEVRE